MKKFIVFLIVLTIMPTMMMADGYSKLWKQVEQAAEDELPQDEMKALQEIVKKAKKQHSYGNLLKAELLLNEVMLEISPDSAAVAFRAIETETAAMEGQDPVMAAVYNCVLGKMYREGYSAVNPEASYSEGYDKAKECYRKAMSNPALLARHKAGELKPALVEGYHSYIYNHDLLSVIGYETKDFETLHNWYESQGMRAASMMTALQLMKSKSHYERNFEKSQYRQQLDSLIEKYGDLKECGEVACERYEHMTDCRDTSTGQVVDYIHEVLDRWGDWPTSQGLRNDLERLTNPSFSAEVETNVQRPGKPTTVKVTSARNFKELTLRITQLDVTAKRNYSIQVEKTYQEMLKKKIAGTERIVKRAYNLPHPYDIVKDTFQIEPLPVGVYMLEFFTDNKDMPVSRSYYYVSALHMLQLSLPNGKQRIVVVDAETGRPVPGAAVEAMWNRPNEEKADEKVLYTNEQGEIIHAYAHKPESLWASTADDKSLPSEYDRWYNYFQYHPESQKTVPHAEIYTDRQIYRPGQTVHASIMVFNTEKSWETKVAEQVPVKLTLMNANNKQVAEAEVTTDEYGTATADFTLPSSGLTGRFLIKNSLTYDSRSFRVEEYKRPTFEVVFDDYKEKYQAGDTIIVTGRARSYAGVPVQGAEVNFTVKRQYSWWYSWGNNDHGTTIDEGRLTTDDEGKFLVKVPLTLPPGDNGFYNFNIHATATDLGGESHEGDMNLPVGRKAAALMCDLPKQSEKEKVKEITFTLRNASGQNLDGEVTYKFDDGKELKAPANKPVPLNAKAMASGKHELQAWCMGDTLKVNFVLFSLNDTKPCIETHDWFYQTEKTFPRDAQPVSVQIGTSDEDTYIYYNVISGDKVLENGMFKLSDAVKTSQFKYDDEYGSGLLLSYAWMKKGKLYTHTTTIERPLPDKRLMLSWTTFRDKLKPGQKERWSLSVKRPDGTTAMAQMVATMYDKSLDQLVPFSWNVDLGIYQALPSTRWNTLSFISLSESSNVKMKLVEVEDLRFSHIDKALIDGFINNLEYPSHHMMLTGAASGTRMLAKRLDALPAPMPSAYAMEESKMMDEEVSIDALSDNSAEKKEGSSEQVRENLNETAFFYPQHVTDKNGIINLVFTLPESITTWQFKAMAHDKDMNFGWLEGTCVAKKDVMVQPNMPRFIRQGDKATIAAKIFNTSDHDVSGKANLQLIDPETQQVAFERTIDFKVAKEKTESVVFPICSDDFPTEPLSLYVCKITASGKGFSDGEQHYLPMLPNTEWVTNTLPITQHEPGTFTADLKKLFPEGASQQKLTVEYTNNPAWLMVQALPYIGNPNEKNAISLVSAYYANKTGLFILQQSPIAKSTFEQWRMEKGEETSLMSSLQKNQDVKNLVLEETPWVLEAESETSQKQALANFFEENTLNERTQSALQKLKQLQNGDGSFSWWPGMLGSPCMTAEVMEYLVRLNMLIGKQSETEAMLASANRFLGNVVVKEIEQIKKDEKEGKPVYIYSWHALQWLYLQALSDFKMSSKEKEAKEYLLNYIESKKHDQDLYAKALTAIILLKDGQKDKARTYVESLKQYTVFTEEMGRYYDTKRASYSWKDYRIPTQVAVIEALRTVLPNEEQFVEEMKRWLLQEKRTQSWDTPINSVNAVYAFLNGNSNILDSQDPTTLAVDGKKIETPKATAGLGYVKTQAPANGQTFTATKTSTGTSWGALYAQFTQKTHDISSAASEMQISRDVLVDGKPMKEGQVLHVGDKVKVRIIVKAERDYDFVQVSDKRAACMEPVDQLSGYHWGYYIAPKDQATNYYFDIMRKGTHIVEKEYYVDRTGTYETGTCTVQCAYSPEFSARAKSITFTVK